MSVLLWLLLSCIQAVIATELVYRNYTCVPSSYTKICILDGVHYRPDLEQHVIHSFPPNQSHIRIMSKSRSSGHPRAEIDLDATFYTLIGRPAVLEVLQHDLWNLELPRALRRGLFPDTGASDISVEPGADTPLITYLDLTKNFIDDISSTRSLVNLEVLLLRDNEISSIDPETMQNFTKLRYLDLSSNMLTQLSTNIYPTSLTHLNLYHCQIKDLNYDDLHFPSLQALNIERNELTSIDAPGLILAMPKLKLIRIAGNHFEEDDFRQTLQLFLRHNISVRSKADRASCRIGEAMIEGVCFGQVDPSEPRSVVRDVGLSLVLVVAVVTLVAILRWTIIAMGIK